MVRGKGLEPSRLVSTTTSREFGQVQWVNFESTDVSGSLSTSAPIESHLRDTSQYMYEI